MGFAKIFVGLILLGVPISLYVYDIIASGSLPFGIEPIRSLFTLLQGFLPPLTFLAGAFVFWLALDELRSKREKD